MKLLWEKELKLYDIALHEENVEIAFEAVYDLYHDTLDYSFSPARITPKGCFVFTLSVEPLIKRFGPLIGTPMHINLTARKKQVKS